MGKIQINRDDIVDPFAVAPPGTYTIECTHGELRDSNAGDQMVELRHRIVGGDVEDIEEHLGKNLRDYMVISGDSAKFGIWRLQQYCEVAGLDIEDLDPEEFIGHTFEVVIDVDPPRPDFDQESNKIKKIFTEV